jgi:3-methylcrotonyl-CoA carboxylase alpha subunit
MFQKILIANRGEIACRVMRTARRLGIKTVAVYSEADAGALHVAMADEALPIGPSPARESYLSIPNIIAAAKKSGAEAIHPGYGFLSENADFAAACEAADIVFIGPSAVTIRAMGSKAEAKALMEKAGVALVPGYHGADQSDDVLADAARDIGFPVLVKASAGGGGKGMRLVEREAEFAAALASARREAKSAFGDDRMLVEKYLTRPRHIEVQVFGDGQGNVVHLFERDCSIQRRHQKLIEEAPAPGLSEAQRASLGAQAIAAAHAVNYRGAGTVEFVAADGAFYFIEMNTRLQVEHVVTEMITGLDLVEWQLRVAAGEALPLTQTQITRRGHAIEVRLYAEDPARDFLPGAGRLGLFQLPEARPDLRIETGFRAGDTITPYYDAMIAKVIAWGDDRPAALQRLTVALGATRIAGLASNRDLLRHIVTHPDFATKAQDTGFIERNRATLLVPVSAPPQALIAAGCGLLTDQSVKPVARDPHSPWRQRDGWRLVGTSSQRFVLRDGDGERELRFSYEGDHYRCALDGVTYELTTHPEKDRHCEERSDAAIQSERRPWIASPMGASAPEGREGAPSARNDDAAQIDFTIDGTRIEASVYRAKDEIWVVLDDGTYRLGYRDPLLPRRAVEAGPRRLTAPLPGKVSTVLVTAGAAVKRGQVLILLEAMKMEHAIVAPADGTVERVNYAPGDLVAEGAELLVFAASAS